MTWSEFGYHILCEELLPDRIIFIYFFSLLQMTLVNTFHLWEESTAMVLDTQEPCRPIWWQTKLNADTHSKYLAYWIITIFVHVINVASYIYSTWNCTCSCLIMLAVSLVKKELNMFDVCHIVHLSNGPAECTIKPLRNLKQISVELVLAHYCQIPQMGQC